MIEVVTLDLWNTLLRARREVLSEHGFDRGPDEIKKAYVSASDHARRVWELENHRHLPIEERLDHILAEMRVELSPDTMLEIIGGFQEVIWNDLPPLKDGVTETLEALEPMYRMGIISDSGITPGPITREVLRNRGILGFFESTVFSDEVGLCKPHRAMFRTSMSELEAEPSEAVHVGDLLRTDVAGAKTMGMRAVWLRPKDAAFTGRWTPDFEITALPELMEILGKIGDR